MGIKNLTKTEPKKDLEFLNWIEKEPAFDKIKLCIQCGTCSAVCPLSNYMDKTPRRIIYLLREGFEEDVLSSFTPWLCASCYSCRVNCPKEIKITDVMYAIKRRSVEKKIYPKRLPTAIMTEEFSRMIKLTGRITESYLSGIVMLRTSLKRLFSMAGLGMRMFFKGRISILPDTVKDKESVKRVLKNAK